MRALLILAILVSASAAHAGYCLGDEERLEEMTKIEAYAKTPAVEHYGPAQLWCVTRWAGESKHKDVLHKRAIAACTKIATFKSGTYRGMIEECQDFLVRNGTVKAGTTDLAERIMARPSGAWDEPTLEILAVTKDPRAHDHIVAKLRATLTKLGKAKLLGWKVDASRKYSLDAIAALERVGTAADTALLDDLAAAANDAKVTAAATKVRDQLARRP